MTERCIVHVDMDAFFAAVEIRDDPSLAGKPIAVGGSSWDRGVIATASYEARKFGVRSAMPTSRAERLCPSLVLIRPNFAKYQAASDQVFAIFGEATPLVEGLSVDEAYLDVTENAWGLPGVEVAKRIKERIRAETKLTASAGVAPNKLLAKIASGWKKPDGLTVIRQEEAQTFLAELPVDVLWGIGPATAERLAEIGVKKVADILSARPGALRRVVGSYADTLVEFAMGRDTRPVETEHVRKSIGCQNTFPEDLTDLREMREAIEEMARDLARQLAEWEETTRTVQLRVRFSDFSTITRRHTSAEPTANADEIARQAVALLEKTEAGRQPVRLLGVSLTLYGAEVDEAAANDRQLRLPFPG